MAEKFYKGKIPIIYRDLDEGFLRGRPPADFLATGAVPRNYDEDPVLLGDSPASLKTLEDDEARDIFHSQEKDESSLEHLYLRDDNPAFEFLDQNGFPDCWVHSTAHAVMFDRLKQNLPVIRINAVAVATMLKRTNGGWSGLSMKFGREHGWPTVAEWPYQSRMGRDTPELRAAMATRKVTEDWYDLGRKEWDQKLSRRQLITLGSQNIPCPVDYNRFGHAILQVRVVDIGGVLCSLIINSWKTWGFHGLGVLYNIWPDGACALRSTNPTVS
jgi:hypothetical protein